MCQHTPGQPSYGFWLNGNGNGNGNDNGIVIGHCYGLVYRVWGLEGQRGPARFSVVSTQKVERGERRERERENTKTVFKIFCVAIVASARDPLCIILCVCQLVSLAHLFPATECECVCVSVCVCVRARGQRLSRRHIAKPHSCRLPGNSAPLVRVFPAARSSWNPRQPRHAK